MNIVAECSISTGSGQHSRKWFFGFLQANELLIELADRHGDFEKLVEAEQRRYNELGGTSAVAREIAKAFTVEIARRIQREIEYY